MRDLRTAHSPTSGSGFRRVGGLAGPSAISRAFGVNSMGVGVGVWALASAGRRTRVVIALVDGSGVPTRAGR